MNLRHAIPVLLFAALGTLLTAPMYLECCVVSTQAALQHPGQENAESRAKARTVYTLTVEKVPQASVIQCVADDLEHRGWRVLPFKKEKKQLLATLDVEADELGRIADTKRGEGTIHWDRGRVNLILTFSTSHNTTSVDLKARILAEGETSRVLLRPTNWWPLPSTGVLEGDVIAALSTHCGFTK